MSSRKAKPYPDRIEWKRLLFAIPARALLGRDDNRWAGHKTCLAPGTPRFIVAGRFRHPAKKPIEAYIERISHITEAVKGKVNGGCMKFGASVSRKSCP